MCTILTRIKDNALGQSPKDKSVDLSDLGPGKSGAMNTFREKRHWATAISNGGCQKGIRNGAQFSVYENHGNKHTSARRRESLRRRLAGHPAF